MSTRTVLYFHLQKKKFQKLFHVMGVMYCDLVPSGISAAHELAMHLSTVAMPSLPPYPVIHVTWHVVWMCLFSIPLCGGGGRHHLQVKDVRSAKGVNVHAWTNVPPVQSWVYIMWNLQNYFNKGNMMHCTWNHHFSEECAKPENVGNNCTRPIWQEIAV